MQVWIKALNFIEEFPQLATSKWEKGFRVGSSDTLSDNRLSNRTMWESAKQRHQDNRHITERERELEHLESLF